MKKLICVLLVLSFILGFSATAFADVLPYYPSVPSVPSDNLLKAENEAVVTNSSGAADVNDPDKVIPLGATVYIRDYYKDDNGGIIVEVYYYNGETGTETTYYVFIDDLSGPGITAIKNYEGQNGLLSKIKEKLHRLYIIITNKITYFGYYIKNLWRILLILIRNL